ncbi:MAG: hypothetical protein GQ578_03055 [Desulfuromonadaceae bacterium]|nr:hypothetical protein [Desulfuromonadaceae bacterium]
MRYNKPPITVDQQAELLIERGLICDDLPRLKRYLASIGYYRLSAYWLPFEQPSTDPVSRNHSFRPDTDFDQVLSLYIFDRKLRLVVLDALERIEVAVRRVPGTAYLIPLSITSYLVFRAVFPPSPNPHHRHILLGKSRRSRGRSLYF